MVYSIGKKYNKKYIYYWFKNNCILKNKFIRRILLLDKGLRFVEGESKFLVSEKFERLNECMCWFRKFF